MINDIDMIKTMREVAQAPMQEAVVFSAVAILLIQEALDHQGVLSEDLKDFLFNISEEYGKYIDRLQHSA